MCFSKRVRASDALILSLSSFRDIVQAVFALSASSSYLRLLGQDILASAEDCIPTKQPLYLPARSQVQSYPASPVPQFPIKPFRLSPSDPGPFRPFLKTATMLHCRPRRDGMANLSGIVKQLKEERDRVRKQLVGLETALTAFASAYSGSRPSRKRRKLSAKSRAKIAAAQRARWAKVRAKRKN
jgi:hypothetical protein